MLVRLIVVYLPIRVQLPLISRNCGLCEPQLTTHPHSALASLRRIVVYKLNSGFVTNKQESARKPVVHV